MSLPRDRAACAHVPFEYLTYFFENCSVAAGKKKRQHLEKFRQKHVPVNSEDSFAIYRLILPALDKQRGNYHLKEAKLASALVRACNLDPRTSVDARRALDWKKVTTARAGNFSGVMEEYLFRKHCGLQEDSHEARQHTIGEINQQLSEIADEEDLNGKVLRLRWLVTHTTAKQMKWIIQIILKDMKIGISEKSVFKDFHPDAEDMYNVTMDLERVCKELRDPSKRMKRKDVEPGNAARPQLAKAARSPEAAFKELKGKAFVTEIKFDGERVQLHRDGDEFWYFSRRGLERSSGGMFDVFGAVARRQIKWKRCILDGEMIVWNARGKYFEPFGTLRSTLLAGRSGAAGDDVLAAQVGEGLVAMADYEAPQIKDIRIVFVAFDVLYSIDQSVITRPLKERQRLLREAFFPVPEEGVRIGSSGLFGLIAPLLPDVPVLGGQVLSKVGHTLSDMNDMYEISIDRKEEGIVLKSLDSQWKTNDRSSAWLKIKPEYLANHEVDAVIIGADYGTGRRGGKLSEYLLGLASLPSRASRKVPSTFVTFCRVGTGVSGAEREAIESKLKSNLVGSDRPPPRHYRTTGRPKERPDVWVADPLKSVVLQVKAEIRTIVSREFATKHSLRFPRVDRVRWDKSPADVMTEQELDQIVEKHQGSLAEGKVAPGKEDAAKKRKGFSPQKATRSAIVQHFLPADVSGVAVESDVLAGSAVCFLDYGKHKKHELEAIVRRLGGKVFMNIVPAVKYVFGQDVDSYKMKSAVRAEKADILSIDWLLECASKGGRVPLQPRHYIYLAPQGNGENAVERFFERSDARFSHRDVRAMLERHLTSDAADRLLSQVPFGEVVAPLDEAGLLDDDRAIFWGCCMCFVDAIEPATDGPPSREAVPGPFLHGVAEAARATAPGWRWRRWWEWEKLKIEVRLRGSQLSSALVKGVTHLVLSNATSSDKPADARELLQVLANSGACKETLSWLKRQLLRGEVMLVSRRWIEDCISGEGSLDARSCRIPSDGYRAVFAPADVGDWPWSDFGVVEALPVPGKAVGGAVAQTADRKGRGRRRGRSKAARQVVRRRTAGVRTRGRARRGGITTIEEGGDAEHGFSGEPSGGGNEGAHEGTSDQCAPAMHEEANSQPSDSSGPTRANSDGRGLRAECPGRLRRRTHKPDADEMESHAAGGSIEDFETSDDKNPSDPDFSPSLEDTPVGSKRKRRTSSRVIDETEEEDSEDSGLPAQQRPPGAMASLLEESTQPLPWEPRQDTHSTATASRSAAPRSGISAALDAVTDSDASPGPGSPHEAPTIDGTHKGSQPTGSATGALSSDHQQIFGGREPQTKTGEQEEGGSGYQRLTALLAQHGPLLVPSRDSGTRHGDPTVPTKSTAAPMEVKAEEHTVCDLGATKGNEEKESQKNNKKTSLFGERVRALLGDT